MALCLVCAEKKIRYESYWIKLDILHQSTINKKKRSWVLEEVGGWRSRRRYEKKRTGVDLEEIVQAGAITSTC